MPEVSLIMCSVFGDRFVQHQAELIGINVVVIIPPRFALGVNRHRSTLHQGCFTSRKSENMSPAQLCARAVLPPF